MYRVLLVDDHADERETLAFLLNEMQISFEITTAINGKKALELLTTNPFDLIITDVKMPFINGLELAEKVRQSNAEIPIIFVSGYGEFEFVKKALTLQAVDYLLKPINPEEFEQLVQQTINSIDVYRNKSQESKVINQLILDNALHQIINGFDWENLSRREKNVALPFASKIKYLLILDLPSTEKEINTEMRQQLLDTLSETHLLYEQDQYVYFFTTENLHQIKNDQQRLEQACMKAGYSAFTYISKKINSHVEIGLRFNCLKDDLQQQFYSQNRPNSGSSPQLIDDPIAEIQWTNKLLQLLREDRFEDAQLQVRKLITEIENSASVSPAHIRFFFASLLQKSADKLEIDPKITRDTINTIITARNLEPIKHAFDEFLQQQLVSFQQISTTKNDYVKIVKRYISNHYHESIGLEDLAKQVALSPKYLSEIFIQEEGVGIAKYLKDFRIKKAQYLLKETPKKIKQVGEEVGFNNYSYFIKTFRQSVGVTPDNFRKGKGMQL